MPIAAFKLFDSALPYLSKGVVTLGFLMAVVAAIVLIATKGTAKSVDRFMVFAVALTVIGALLEFSRDRDQAAHEEAQFSYFAGVPAEMFEDYITARTQNIFGSRTVGEERFRGYSSVDQKNNLKIEIPPGSCKMYFDTSKPPASISQKVTSEDVKTVEIKNEDYYQESIVCAPRDGKLHFAQVELTLHGYPSDYVLRVWQASNEDKQEWGLFPQEETKPMPFTKIVCTGEYESNCPGTHDIFVPCPNRPIEQIVQLACTGRNGQVTSIVPGISGNRCGYSLLKATCS